MVGHHTQRHIHIVFLTIADIRICGYFLDDRLEDIRVIVGFLVLHSHAEAFEAHARIDVLGRQRVQLAGDHAVELHEHEVPNLDDERVVLVHQLGAGNFGTFLVVAQVDVDFRARAARTGVAHFPEVVLLVALQDAVFRQKILPEVVCFLVESCAVFLVAGEDGGVKARLVELHHLGEELPGVGDGLFLEIVAERPVAEHLEHGVVVSVAADLFQVVVLAGDTEALLRVGHTRKFAGRVPEEDVLELVHTGIGEHQCRVIFHHHRRGRHDVVAFGLEKVQKSGAYFVRCHILEKLKLQKYNFFL